MQMGSPKLAARMEEPGPAAKRRKQSHVEGIPRANAFFAVDLGPRLATHVRGRAFALSALAGTCRALREACHPSRVRGTQTCSWLQFLMYTPSHPRPDPQTNWSLHWLISGHFPKLQEIKIDPRKTVPETALGRFKACVEISNTECSSTANYVYPHVFRTMFRWAHHVTMGISRSDVDLTPFRDVESFCLDCAWETSNVGPLARVPRISLIVASAVKDLSPLHSPGVDERRHVYIDHRDRDLKVSAFRTAHTVSFSSQCDINEYLSKGSVCRNHNVEIEYGYEVEDLTPLATACTLSLERFDKVTDVAPLANVADLTLEDFPNVKNVAALRGLRSLVLRKCEQVADVSALGALRTLSIVACPLVVDVSCLGTVQSLTLAALPGVTDVSALGAVPELYLGGLPAVNSVAALARVERLTLKGMDGLREFPEGSGFACKHLTIETCPAVTDLSAMRGVEELVVKHCFELPNLDGLVGPERKVQRLTIINCKKLACVRGAENVDSVRIEDCVEVTDVAPLQHAQWLRIRGCTGARNVEALKRVPELDYRHDNPNLVTNDPLVTLA